MAMGWTNHEPLAIAYICISIADLLGSRQNSSAIVSKHGIKTENSQHMSVKVLFTQVVLPWAGLMASMTFVALLTLQS